MMFRYLPPIALILWATSSTAAIQSSDFWFHNDGDILFIDGQRGAPLHIDYIGPPLPKALTVRITPQNSQLKVSPPTCTFTKKDDDCRLVLRKDKADEEVYGVNEFWITEIEKPGGVLNTQPAPDTATIRFGVGLQGKDMPKPIIASLTGSLTVLFKDSTIGKVLTINATQKERSYKTNFTIESARSYVDNVDSKEYSLPPKTLCYADVDLTDRRLLNGQRIVFKSNANISPSSTFDTADITIPSDPIYNGFYATGDRNISTCSAKGDLSCVSNKWSSWVIGLANTGSTDMEGGVRSGQVELLNDNSWNNGSYIYYDSRWNGNSLSLLLLQGSTDGSPFDAKAVAPSVLEIQSAPPCSYYLKPDQSVTYSVQVKSFGPGTIIMPAGGQCQKYSTPGQDFTYCTGGGYKDSWYEITAVPDAGKTFKGWYSSGLCDDASTTCRFQLTRDVGMKPYFW